MQDKLVGVALLVVVAVIGLFLLVGLLDWVLPDAAPLGDWADTVLAVVTVLAILFGGLFAAVKFELFRDFEPHLTLSHTINHRNIGNNYVHIDVTAVLHNSSRVRVEVEGNFAFQQVVPVMGEREPDEQIESLVFSVDIQPFMEWAIIGERQCSKMSIEPGQTHQETVEIIIPDDILTIAIHTYFRASDFEKLPQAVWGLTSVYDIASAA